MKEIRFYRRSLHATMNKIKHWSDTDPTTNKLRTLLKQNRHS